MHSNTEASWKKVAMSQLELSLVFGLCNQTQPTGKRYSTRSGDFLLFYFGAHTA